jgi:uncharacterized membrane protein
MPGHAQELARPRHDGRVRPVRGRAEGAGTNVGDTERLLSVLGGAAAAALGLWQRGVPGLLLAAAGGALLYRGLTGHSSCYAALGINTAEKHPASTSVPAGEGVRVEQAITIQRPAQELYRAWRDLEELPRIMSHLESVRVFEGNHSRWAARALGMRVEWDAEIINDKEGELIAWRSLEGSQVDTAGSVHFRPAPGGRGTEVRVVLKYLPPAGKTATMVAWLLGQSPEGQIAADLRRFKELMEAGEAATTKGQPRGQ